MIVFDGKRFASEKKARLIRRVEELRGRGITPKMISILADNTPESRLYVSLKAKFAEDIGAIYEIHDFDAGQTRAIVEDIQKANTDLLVHGIMVQLPVVNEEEIVSAINPAKDVDCLTAENLGWILAGKPKILPATVQAVTDIIAKALVETGAETKGEKWLGGKNVCIVGASVIVGKPLAILFSELGATVTVCRSRTQNLAEITRRADILVSATGVTELITKEMVKPASVVIDVGISKLLRGGRFQVVGDVDKSVLGRTAFFTPVPGGVGPVTVACLFGNLLDCCSARSS